MKTAILNSIRRTGRTSILPLRLGAGRCQNSQPRRLRHLVPPAPKYRTEAAAVRVSLILTVVIAIGLAALIWSRAPGRPRVAAENSAADESTISLSDGTKAVLHGVKSPVEIRYYCILDPASTPDALRAFAGRVDSLLSEYQRRGNGKIKLVRVTDREESDLNAALAKGIHPINLDKGDGSYLGIIVLNDQQKGSLVQLSEQWEPAVEIDLSRAIAALSAPKPSADLPAITSTADAASVQALLRSNPDLASATVEQGTQMLRNQALQDFAAAAKDLQSQLQKAEQDFAAAQNANSESGQEAARAALTQARADQEQSIAVISSRFQKQLAAFQQYKSTAQ